MHIARKTLLVTAALLAFAETGHAQTRSAVFAGTVVDSVQRPIPNAEVSLPGMGITKTTDDKGAFRLTDIPAGNQGKRSALCFSSFRAWRSFEDREGRAGSSANAGRRAVPDSETRGEHGAGASESALVYLDRALMNAGKPTTPFDANTVATMQLQAIEWYESAGGVSGFYSSQDIRCGVLILHTRRSR